MCADVIPVLSEPPTVPTNISNSLLLCKAEKGIRDSPSRHTNSFCSPAPSNKELSNYSKTGLVHIIHEKASNHINRQITKWTDARVML